MAQNYYELLGVQPDVSDAELKRAYRALARRYHPDVGGGDPESEDKFKEITVAYETLRDPEKRARYDRFGPEGVNAGAGGFGDGFGITDIFDAFFSGDASPFGRRGRSPGPAVGTDAEVRVSLDFVEAALGTTQTVAIEMAAACNACDGSGCAPGTHPSTCRSCGGAGQVRQMRRSVLGQMMSTQTCRECSGLGNEVLSPCHECGGVGLVVSPATIEIQIPAGIADGQRLRMSGRGPAGPRGGVPGDLYVAIHVVPHPTLERRGDDLIQQLRISMTQATLGFDTQVESLEGPEELTVPPGTQPGRVFKLRGRGVPSLQGHRRGDLLVEVTVEIPERLRQEETELLHKLAELRGEQVAQREEGLFSRIRSTFQ